MRTVSVASDLFDFSIHFISFLIISAENEPPTATVSKTFSTAGDRLLKSGVLQLEDGATRSKTCPNITNVSFTVPCVCISGRCNTTLPRNQTCTNEPCRQSNPCVLREKTNPRPKISLPMYCVDFSCWKTRHSQDQNKCLSLCVAGKSYAYNHIANALREAWGNDDRLRSHDIALSQQLQGGHHAGRC